MHLVALLGNYGPHYRMLPNLIRYGGSAFVCVDHRMPLTERIERIAEVMTEHDCPVVERVVVDPPPLDCENGVHDFHVLSGPGGICLGAQCRACRAFEPARPSIRFVENTASVC